ncbi:hypothetical protein OHA77_28560 [Streptosporangium sp. NBC_01639]|uniref:hypothetical protein n=1 Tax=Streptosporangium sp. NBC_01639 TaxID=2975948 RepID=UPI00386B7E26|nr:hypothetical protein OHA77_28560 [Streptosporangium sp. NBC_01639]
MRGSGEAGPVRAVVVDGRLASLTMDARSLSLTPEKLAGHVLAAVNAALDDIVDQSGPDPFPAVDPLALARQFREIRDDFDVQMGHVTGSIQASARKLRQEADVAAEVPSLDFRQMFDQLIDVLEAVGGASHDEAEEPLGEGLAARQMVRVVCGPGPRLVSVTIQQRAMRGTAELCDHLVSAVNQAVDGLQELQERRGAGPDEIMARIGELQESGVTQLRVYGQALNAFMGSIRPRD